MCPVRSVTYVSGRSQANFELILSGMFPQACIAIGQAKVEGQAGPGNDINAGSPGFQKAPTRGPASLVAIRL